MREGAVAGIARQIIALGWGLGAFAHAAAQDRPLAGDFAEVYRAGGANAEEWAFFADSARAAFDGDGNLHVLDAAAGRVVVIDAEGRLARIVGRAGEGPGELNTPADIVVWRDGRLAVMSLGHAGYQLFTPDGEPERLVRMGSGQGPMAMFGMIRAAVRPDPGGGALVAQGPPSAMQRMGSLMRQAAGGEQGAAPGGVDDRGLERLALSGDMVSATPILQGWRPPREEAEDLSLSDLMNPSAMMGMIADEPFFEPGFHWDLLPDGTIAYSDSSAYAIKIADSGGEVTDVLTRPLSPEPVTARIREGAVADALREMDEAADNPQMAEVAEIASALMPGMMEAVREAIENRAFRDEVPVVRAVRATWDGGLWIQRGGEDPWNDDGPIDVFGGDREYVGTLPPSAPGMPSAFGPDGLALYWELDEMDVPIIVVKRLPEGVR